MGGLGVSVFSKPLALLIGLGVIIVQVSRVFWSRVVYNIFALGYAMV
jgi:hypothetical protein